MTVHLDHLIVPTRVRVASARLLAGGIAYRSHPQGDDDRQVNTAFGGRLVYWGEPDGHAWEILTVSYARRGAAS